MKAEVTFLFLSLSLAVMAEAQPATPSAETSTPSPGSAVHGRILELLKQDVAKIPVKPKEASAPFLNPDSVANNQPVTESVLELEPVVVTQKKPVELPLRLKKVTLDNFFYGDGTIFESADKRFSISAGRDALIKFNWKF